MAMTVMTHRMVAPVLSACTPGCRTQPPYLTPWSQVLPPTAAGYAGGQTVILWGPRGRGDEPSLQCPSAKCYCCLVTCLQLLAERHQSCKFHCLRVDTAAAQSSLLAVTSTKPANMLERHHYLQQQKTTTSIHHYNGII